MWFSCTFLASILFLQLFHLELFCPEHLTSPTETDEFQTLLQCRFQPFTQTRAHFKASLRQYPTDNLPVSETSLLPSFFCKCTTTRLENSELFSTSCPSPTRCAVRQQVLGPFRDMVNIFTPFPTPWPRAGVPSLAKPFHQASPRYCFCEPWSGTPYTIDVSLCTPLQQGQAHGRWVGVRGPGGRQKGQGRPRCPRFTGTLGPLGLMDLHCFLNRLAASATAQPPSQGRAFAFIKPCGHWPVQAFHFHFEWF